MRVSAGMGCLFVDEAAGWKGETGEGRRRGTSGRGVEFDASCFQLCFLFLSLVVVLRRRSLYVSTLLEKIL